LSSRVVVGLGPAVQLASSTWRRAAPGLDVRGVEVPQRSDFRFVETSLDDVVADACFVAVDHRFLGFKRLELLGLLRARGLCFANVTAPTAVLGEGVVRGDNVLIGDGAVVGDACLLEEGVWIGAAAIVGAGAVIGRGATIEPGAIVGARAVVGAQTHVTSGVVIGEGAEIGPLAVLGVPGLVLGPVAPRTFLHPSFDEPIRILG
jgi:carbonic anhydrase/acetyltransferase-like protein (isoleucine patch superfamily)